MRERDGTLCSVGLLGFLTSSCPTSIPYRHGARELAKVCSQGNANDGIPARLIETACHSSFQKPGAQGINAEKQMGRWK